MGDSRKKIEKKWIETPGGIADMGPRPDRPLLWGKYNWAVEGVGSPEPEARPEDPYYEFHAIIRLACIDAAAVIPTGWDWESMLAGDSNYVVPQNIAPVTLSIEVGQKRFAVTAKLIANEQGRLGAIHVRVHRAQRALDASRAVHSVFDALVMQLSFETDLQIREAAFLLVRADSKVRVGRFLVGYPILEFDGGWRPASPIMQRLVAPFADAIRSPSTHYSFLVHYSLLEFLSGPWTGAIKAAYGKRGIAWQKRPQMLDQSELDYLAPWLKGKTYKELLAAYKHLRNKAGGGHFNFSIGPRAGTNITDDELACVADVLRIVVKQLLVRADEDVRLLVASDSDGEGALANEIEQFMGGAGGQTIAAPRRRRSAKRLARLG
jgi:hypothetical protein